MYDQVALEYIHVKSSGSYSDHTGATYLYIYITNTLVYASGAFQDVDKAPVLQVAPPCGILCGWRHLELYLAKITSSC